MRWFGFGFNVFGQIYKKNETEENPLELEVRLNSPTELPSVNRDEGGSKARRIRASWSRRASFHSDDGGCVWLAGFGISSSQNSRGVVQQSHGCTDVFISESHLSLTFRERVECWDLSRKEDTPTWSMEVTPESGSSDVELPLVPGGYLASKPPLFRSLPSHIHAKMLALGGEHAVLLTVTGTVYTWGQGSHGQLGHGGLTPEEEPRTVEALWGMKMSSVSAGGWHTTCISDGGDLYVWGWNESGQLGLPSRSMRKSLNQEKDQDGELRKDVTTSQGKEQEDKEKLEVFISIQAFPALLDVTPLCEIKTVSCGSRHTAAVTTAGHLYTWGWGDYGQLGHQSFLSSDEPQCVEFFRQQQLQVVDVVCGHWNTFAAVIPLTSSNEH